MPLLYGITGVESALATPRCDCLAHRFGNAWSVH